MEMTERYSRGLCLELLRRKKEELGAAGENRCPERADFSPEEVVAVKAFLGPWPRALEAAGLKSPKTLPGEEKRIRAKRRRTAAQKTDCPAAAETDQHARSVHEK